MKLILGFVMPLMLGLLLQEMYSMVDTMIVGKLLGADSLAAVGSSGEVNFLVLGFCMGICSGFAIPVAQRFGAGDMSGLRRFLANSLWLCIAISIVLTVLTVVFCEPIMRLIRTPEDIFEESCAYIRVIFAGIPAIFLYNMLSGIIRSLGDSKTPVFFLALAAVMNIVLDIVFVVLLKTDASGTAVATVISQGISGVACFFYMKKKFPMLKIQKNELKLDKYYVKTLCSIGIPMGLQYSITAIGSVILQSSVNSLGTTYVAAVSGANKMGFFCMCPFDALGTTMATYGGQNVGAKKTERLSSGMKSAIFIAFVYSAAAFLLLMIFSRTICLLFIDSSEGEIIELMRQFLLTNAAFYILLSLVEIVRFMIQGMGFGTFSMFSGLSEMVARSLFGLFFVPMFGFTAVCFASPAAWLFADLFLIPGYLYCLKKLDK